MICFHQTGSSPLIHTSKQAQQHSCVAGNSPHSGQSRCCPAATAGIPRISPGPCWAAGGVTHHLLPEDTAAEYPNGTPTPAPTWGLWGSPVETARPHGGATERRTGPVWDRRWESTRPSSATFCPQTHVEKKYSVVYLPPVLTLLPAL